MRHNEILGIIAEIAKMCCETANEIPCIKTNIQFVKEGNRHKPTLLDGCTDWRVIADVDRQLAFPTEKHQLGSVQISSFGQLIQKKLSLQN